MQFEVRYWVETPPVPRGNLDDGWLSHSIHPATRLGLHNAVLSAQDRLDILRNLHGTVPHGCDIVLRDAEVSVLFSIAEAEQLCHLMQAGKLSCDTIESLLHAGQTSSPGCSGYGSIAEGGDEDRPPTIDVGA